MLPPRVTNAGSAQQRTWLTFLGNCRRARCVSQDTMLLQKSLSYCCCSACLCSLLLTLHTSLPSLEEWRENVLLVWSALKIEPTFRARPAHKKWERTAVFSSNLGSSGIHVPRMFISQFKINPCEQTLHWIIYNASQRHTHSNNEAINSDYNRSNERRTYGYTAERRQWSLIVPLESHRARMERLFTLTWSDFTLCHWRHSLEWLRHHSICQRVSRYIPYGRNGIKYCQTCW